MHIIGLVAEYNPFHNGHLYQINKIKSLYPDSIIVCVLSGCFMQRGEPSIITKWDKTKIALNNNIDLVIELPFCYATQSSDLFASGAISILKHLKVETIIFGSETDNIELLTKLANIQINDPNYNIIVKKYLDQGLNYPTALSRSLEDLTNIKINKPNDLLGLSYIKEIIKQKANITPISIKRTNDYHNSLLSNNIISASTIRKLIKDNLEVNNYIPYDIFPYYNNINTNTYFTLLKYQIINNINNLQFFQTVDEGIENRIKKYIYKSDNLEELIKNIKTKRYTYNKINRMLTHILCNFTKEEASNLKIEYIKILGFNNKGKKYLNEIKKSLDIPIISKYKSNQYKQLDIEFRISHIYASLLSEEKRNIFIQQTIINKPIIK